jgi:uncharacterized protein (DUF58 family)
MTALATDADALLRTLEWTVIRRLDGLLQGDYRTLFRGGGVDLADLREYQLHDDVRHIDWNVTARLQVPHVRQFHEDRDLTCWFLLDLSGSVDFGSADVTKLAVASGFVAALARVLTRHGNPFQRLGADVPGRVSIDWGVYGVPETYILDRQGIIRWRWAGPVMPENLRDDMMPLLRRLAA